MMADAEKVTGGEAAIAAQTPHTDVDSIVPVAGTGAVAPASLAASHSTALPVTFTSAEDASTGILALPVSRTATGAPPSSTTLLPATTARRWVLDRPGKPDGMHIVEEPLPSLSTRPHDVLIAIDATTATYTDLLVLQNSYRPQFPFPLTPGYDLVGRVIAVGASVTSLAVGDCVAAMPQHGCLTTHTVLPAAEVIKIRADLDPVAAVSVVLTGVTAYQLVHRAAGTRVKAGSAVLVHGCAGGTGAMIADLARLAGATTIYGTCGAKNVAASAARGITAFDYNGDWAGEVRLDMVSKAITGLDVVFDHVTTGGYRSKGIKLLKSGGKYLAYGFTNKGAPGEVNVMSLMGSLLSVTLQNSVNAWFDGREAHFYAVTRERKAHPEQFKEDLVKMLELVSNGSIKPLEQGRVWEFEQGKDALVSIAAMAHVGKQVVRVTPQLSTTAHATAAPGLVVANTEPASAGAGI